MKVLKFTDEEAWLKEREGKITGSIAGKIILKKGGVGAHFWTMLKNRVSVPHEEIDPRDHGHLYEGDAINRLVKETGIKFVRSLEIWERADNKNIAVSPDASIKNKTIAAEAKCLDGGLHLQAWFTKNLPSEYDEQFTQYFVVNDKLKTLYVAFYNPHIPSKEFFYFMIERRNIEDKIADFLQREKETLQKLDEYTYSLIGF